VPTIATEDPLSIVYKELKAANPLSDDPAAFSRLIVLGISFGYK